MGPTTPIVSFDCETHRIQQGLLAPPLVCGAFATVDHAELMDPRDTVATFWEFVKSDHVFVGVNIAYDFGVLSAYDIATLPAIFDLYDSDRVCDLAINESLQSLATDGTAPSFSLDQLVKLRLGRDDAKANDEYRLRYHELDGIPLSQWPDVAKQYPIDDVQNALEVARAQARLFQHRDVYAQSRAAFALHLGAVWGFRVDQQAVSAYESAIEQKRLGQYEALAALGIFRHNGTKDTAKVKRLLLEAYGVTEWCDPCAGVGILYSKKCPACEGTGLRFPDNLALTAGGSISTNRDALHESGSETLLELAAYEETNKAVSTYVPYLQSAGDRPLTLRPNVLLETGRASYSGGIQTFPRKGGERACIVPRSGNVFYSVDYTGLELVTHAQSCLWLLGESKLAYVLNDGGKPHDLLAATLAGVTYKEFAKRFAEGDKVLANYRQAAKPANFGFPGGMGALRLVQQQRAGGPDTASGDRVYRGLRFCIMLAGAKECGTVKITEYKNKPCAPVCKACVDAAEGLRSAWFTQWPENNAYFKFINDRVRMGKIVQHVSKRIRNKINFTNAANGYFQALAADGAKRALWSVTRAQFTLGSPLFGSHVILFAHDELIGEVPEANASDGVKEVTRLMVEAMRGVCPDVFVAAEPTLMRRWYKEAKCIYNKDGSIGIWEDR